MMMTPEPPLPPTDIDGPVDVGYCEPFAAAPPPPPKFLPPFSPVESLLVLFNVGPPAPFPPPPEPPKGYGESHAPAEPPPPA